MNIIVVICRFARVSLRGDTQPNRFFIWLPGTEYLTKAHSRTLWLQSLKTDSLSHPFSVQTDKVHWWTGQNHKSALFLFVFLEFVIRKINSLLYLTAEINTENLLHTTQCSKCFYIYWLILSLQAFCVELDSMVLIFQMKLSTQRPGNFSWVFTEVMGPGFKVRQDCPQTSCP